MSRFIRGDSVQIMAGFPNNSIDFILTDPPYLVGFKDRSGRLIDNDLNDESVLPASREMFHVLKNNSLGVSFTAGTAWMSLCRHGNRRVSALSCISFSPKHTHRNQLLPDISMQAPTCWPKGARRCRLSHYPT